MTPLRRGGLAALSGVLLVLSFPKFGHWSVAWVALVPLLLSLPRTSGRSAFGLGYVGGFVSSLGLLYWTSLVVAEHGGVGRPVALAVMTLLCMAVALFTAAFAWLVARWLAALGPGALLLSPFAWVATEVLRAHSLYRFSWCLLGYSQQPNLPFIQIASVTAVYGVSFVVAASSGFLAYAVRVPARRGRALLGLVALTTLVGAHGTWALSRPVEETGRLRVGLVQASIRQDEKWDPAHAWRNVDRHLDLTRRAARGGARLVVWPESALPFHLDRSPGLARELAELAREQGIYLLFGNDDVEVATDGQSTVFVGAKMLTPEGEVRLRYRKMRLVPFGEYTPLEGLITLGGRHTARLVRNVGRFAAGRTPVVAPVEGHGVGAFICYEAIFPDLVRGFTAGGAELLVSITNDGWFGTSSAPYQHFAMAALRAVENRRAVVRAANTGVTGVVDPHGRVLARTALFEATAVVQDVPLTRESTFYARHGDVFGWSVFGLTLGLTAWTLARDLPGRLRRSGRPAGTASAPR